MSLFTNPFADFYCGVDTRFDKIWKEQHSDLPHQEEPVVEENQSFMDVVISSVKSGLDNIGASAGIVADAMEEVFDTYPDPTDVTQENLSNFLQACVFRDLKVVFKQSNIEYEEISSGDHEAHEDTMTRAEFFDELRGVIIKQEIINLMPKTKRIDLKRRLGFLYYCLVRKDSSGAKPNDLRIKFGQEGLDKVVQYAASLDSMYSSPVKEVSDDKSKTKKKGKTTRPKFLGERNGLSNFMEMERKRLKYTLESIAPHPVDEHASRLNAENTPAVYQPKNTIPVTQLFWHLNPPRSALHDTKDHTVIPTNRLVRTFYQIVELIAKCFPDVVASIRANVDHDRDSIGEVLRNGERLTTFLGEEHQLWDSHAVEQEASLTGWYVDLLLFTVEYVGVANQLTRRKKELNYPDTLLAKHTGEMSVDDVMFVSEVSTFLFLDVMTPFTRDDLSGSVISGLSAISRNSILDFAQGSPSDNLELYTTVLDDDPHIKWVRFFLLVSMVLY
jgi:hypothetical protein